MQDHKEDWTTQAALMDKIYSRGLLNLAAMEAERSPGLELARNPLRVAPCLLAASEPEPVARMKDWLCFRTDHLGTALNRAPLYKRGWTFQERLLSRRTVHFGDQLLWECTAFHASEAFPLGTEHPENTERGIPQVKAMLQSQPVTNTTHNVKELRSQLHRLWSDIVRYYSQTELTQPSDRLMALRGIANTVARRFRLSIATDYLAGMWKPILAEQLVWAVESDGGTSASGEYARGLASHFPSWSWASCPGEVSFLTFKAPSRWFVRLDHPRGYEGGAESAGPASLVLRGRLVQCEALKGSFASYGDDLAERGPSFDTTDAVSRAKFTVRIRPDRLDLCLEPPEVYLLPVSEPYLCTVYGLVLIRAGSAREGAGPAVFRRVGVFGCHGYNLKELLMLPAGWESGLAHEWEVFLDTLPPIAIL
ncbi:uncharacterized protein B0H64DRAFT_188999 [Chaetomium fimeti]|uniref:Heterokaryon incompatibility domain-containing protein n=1 Tax=Chaetomium fimeti TaxID=1854472 RepID=A0AAE0HDY6_9PEZI|nr:hypothetical protein B0H64DRAFT_188999 [Chaetomium fimeti]